MNSLPTRSTLFPYTTLFRSRRNTQPCAACAPPSEISTSVSVDAYRVVVSKASRDRKSTRLNSSHLVISYAVFCLKKKKTSNEHQQHEKSVVPTSADLETA